MPSLSPNFASPEQQMSSTKDPGEVYSGRLEPFRDFDQRFSDVGWRYWPAAISALKSAQGLQTGWDSYEAEPPSATSIARMWMLIETIRNRPLPAPYRVVASSEGGMALVFSQGSRLAQIEFLNTGCAFLTMLSDDAMPVVAGFALEHLDAQIQKIQNFLRQ